MWDSYFTKKHQLQLERQQKRYACYPKSCSQIVFLVHPFKPPGEETAVSCLKGVPEIMLSRDSTSVAPVQTFSLKLIEIMAKVYRIKLPLRC